MPHVTKAHRREAQSGKPFLILSSDDEEPLPIDQPPAVPAPLAVGPAPEAEPLHRVAPAVPAEPRPTPAASPASPLPSYDVTVPVRNRPQGTPFRGVLEQIVKAGPRHPLFWWHDSTCTAVYDGFPKATVHLLLLPNGPRIRRADALTAGDLPLVAHLSSVTDRIVAHLRATAYPGWRFQCGFHAHPSLEHLHVHIMTLDFEASPNLKTKKHYNSFATSHFVPLADVLRNLAAGSPAISGSSCRGTDEAMRCFWCAAQMHTVPALKHHLANCPRRRVRDDG